jgi:HEAT repeat protein
MIWRAAGLTGLDGRPMSAKESTMRHQSLFLARHLVLLSAVIASANVALAGVEEDVSALLPRLGTAKVEDRYAAQMELQAMMAKVSGPGAGSSRLEFAKVLAAKAADAQVEQAARVWLVRQLEYIGGEESVPTLTGLLGGTDAELSECARRALEKNPAAEATRSLEAVLEKTADTSQRIGLIHSLGERSDAQAVLSIAKYLRDAQSSAAAATALARIANEPAVESLWTAFDDKNKLAADSLIAAANTLTLRGANKAAAAIYSRLYSNCANTRQRGAALVGLAKTDPATAGSLVEEALRSNDQELQCAALAAAPWAYSKGISQFLAGLLPLSGLSSSAKIYVLRDLNSSVEAQIVSLAHDSDEKVRLAAFERMGQVGSADSVPLLVYTAASRNSDEQKAAASALAVIAGAGVDAAVRHLASEGNASARAAAIQALAARDDTSTLPTLMRFATEADQAVSGAACAALGKMAADAEIEELAQLTLSGKVAGAESALKSAAARAHDKVAATKKLVVLTQQAPPAQQALLFDTLAALGGTETLEAILSATSSSNDDLKDAAIRALADWTDYAATTPLLAIAADQNTKPVYNVLAIQGVVRLVKSSENEPADERLKTTLAAMTAARRVEEKRLAISALATLSTSKSADTLKSFLQDPKLKVDAAQAGVTLADALAKTDRAAATELAQAIVDSNASDATVRHAKRLLRNH